MSEFNLAVEYVIKNEGGIEDNPNDPGGVTNMGISLRFLRSIHSDHLKKYGLIVGETINEDDIKHLTLDQVKAIYHGEFWTIAPLDGINNQANANYIFDMAINEGIAPAIKIAQRACWAVMKKYNIIADDGILGNETIDMINHCGIYLLPAMRSERAGYYRLIVADKPTDKEFLNGWLKRAYE